jgi:hypothetical protein
MIWFISIWVGLGIVSAITLIYAICTAKDVDDDYDL